MWILLETGVGERGAAPRVAAAYDAQGGEGGSLWCGRVLGAAGMALELTVVIGEGRLLKWWATHKDKGGAG